MFSLVLQASSFIWPRAYMAAVAKVDLSVGKPDLQAAPALVGRDDDTFDLPAKRFGVLDDDWCARGHILDGLGTLVRI